MKNTFVKTAAFTAAGLMILGSSLPAFAAEARKETQFTEKAASCDLYDQSVLDHWVNSFDFKQVNIKDIKPGEYYFFEDHGFNPWIKDFPVYKLIHIDNIYEEKEFPGLKTAIVADYTNAVTGGTGRAILNFYRFFYFEG
ncbi:MAG: hypothetical protein HUJ54_06435 [Erysipelotrichaceae bacterium]|nr:hypothetical protein [Erysipelotrichaceae bacterium]